MKNRRRTTTKAKRPSAPKVRGRRTPSGTNATTKIALLKRERDEALEQQIATAEVLRVISASPGDLKPVFDAMLANAVRLCEAKFGFLWLAESDGFRPVALHNVPDALAFARRHDQVIHFGSETPIGRLAETRRLVHVADITSDPGYIKGFRPLRELADIGGARTLLLVPMLKHKELVGAFAIYRLEVRPFTEKQIELVENFAAQAVIAIENTRLLTELREFLQQQTATADVLKVISRSTFDLQTVLNTLVESAATLCEADTAALARPKGTIYQYEATFGGSREFHEYVATHPAGIDRTTAVGRALVEGKKVQILDVLTDPEYTYLEASRLSGTRTILGVPLLREGTPIGVLALARRSVRAFTEKQIELVTTFADQAVIAIENARLFVAEQQRTRELSESLEQQTATSEVLSVISSSPGELEPVFQAMLENAVRICEAKFGDLWLAEGDGDGFRLGALYGTPAAYAETWMREPLIHPGPNTGLVRAKHTKSVIQVADTMAEPAYAEREPLRVALVELAGARTLIVVPMLKDNAFVGAIAIYRQEVRPFTDKQVELVQNFAAQAVIAIENTRLLNELRQSLEQQTATADVLRVISTSPGELEPVFGSMLENAVRICEAKFGTLQLRENDGFRVVAMHDPPPAFAEARRRNPLIKPSPHNALGRVVATNCLVHIVDYTQEIAYKQGDPAAVSIVELAGARTFIMVPMLKEGELIGNIVLYRQEVRPFADKQIALLSNFAAQAVIAIENTRLLNELRQRTDDLTESLQQQTATSEVLRVISSSPSELPPVFEAMLRNAVQICDANFGNVFRWDGTALNLVAAHNTPSTYSEARRRSPLRPDPSVPMGRVIATKSVVHIADLSTEQGYAERKSAITAAIEVGGVRTLLAIPMLKEDELVGIITIYRQEVRPFSDKQIALVENFAAQAVIAIENTRLLNELRESLQQQTATADVLRIISSSPGELQPVFQAMLENAVRICEAKFGSLFRFDGEKIQFAAEVGTPLEYAEFQKRRGSVQPRPGTLLDRVVRTKQVIHTADYAAEPIPGNAATLGGARSTLCVPMLKEGNVIGAIYIYRQEIRPFTDKQIELVQNFAAQAVIAIENTRLLNELRESLQQQTATANVLRVISSSPGELEPVFQAMLENAVRICDAKFATLFRFDGELADRIASIGTPAALVEFQLKRGPFKPDVNGNFARCLETKAVVHVADELSEPKPNAAAVYSGARTTIHVPMLKENEAVGQIVIYRQEVRPFTDKQIELVQNFAAQAVIAIENTRLLNELRQRTDDLTESLEQQTATSEVLGVISSSPGELEPVFQAMLENAIRICDAKFGNLLRFDGNAFRFAAGAGIPPKLAEFHRQHETFQPVPGSPLGRAMQTKRVSHTADDAAETLPSPPARLAGARSMVCVPMLKDNTLTGAIVIYRQEVKPFTAKQIELLENFAAQAVIAIENTRLLNELRESLQQQTATADVLKVISSSPGELEPVFQAMLENATRICEAKFGNLALFDGSALRIVALHNAPAALVDRRQREPVVDLEGSIAGVAISNKRLVHIADLAADERYARSVLAIAGGARTALVVPMLKEAEIIGTIAIYRQEVRPFTDKQISLLQNFAAQAVIAIENTRLLNELRESLQQQNATADVLKVISRSTFDLPKVLSTLVESATKLCNADKSYIYQQHDGVYQFAASYGFSADLLEYARQNPITPGRGTITGRVVLGGKTVHVEDVLADPEFTGHGYQSRGDFRTTLGVPLTRNGMTIGVFFLARSLVTPFTNKEIDLVTTFADQAVIAIENARLLSELRQRTDDLTDSLEQQTATSEVLNVISRSKFDLQPILQSVVDTAARLCRADTAVIFRREQGIYRFATGYCLDPRYLEIERSTPITPGPGTVVGRAAMRREAVRIADAMADPLYEKKADAEVAQVRSMMGVPLMRAGEVIGVIALARQRVEPFVDREIELVSTFADQASIAIENVRLFEAEQKRTEELSDALEQQTATSDVLKVISRSTFDLQSVLDTLVEFGSAVVRSRYGSNPPPKG